MKNYTLDYLPQVEGRNHLFTRYEFSVPQDLVFSLRMNCTDKYLLDYLRLKIVDKSDYTGTKAITFNSSQIDNCKLPSNEHGYLLIVEGAMPYNTTEGQI